MADSQNLSLLGTGLGAPLSRRGMMKLGLGVSATAALALSGCGRGDAGGSPTGTLRMTWWGNEKRQANTAKIIEAYKAKVPAVTITPEFTDWAGYWDKLATQTAGDDTPDVIQMDEKYIREYGGRGALLDLAKAGVDVSKFAPGTADAGKTDTGLMGVNAGVNAPVALVNPKFFEAAGIEIPDDKTWTWETLRELGAELTSKSPAGSYGIASFTSGDAPLNAFFRQRGKSLFTATGLGFEAADLVEWLDYQMTLQDKKAIPPASQVAEEAGQALDQTGLATGKIGISIVWSNQVNAYDAATGGDMQMLRLPSTDGTAASAKPWYKASMFWSASARTKDPEAAAAFINYLVNDVESASIGLTERGVPANLEVRAAIADKLGPSDKKVLAFLDAIEPELGEAPAPPPKGAGNFPDILTRYGQEVMFGKAKAADAAQKLITEVTGNIS